MATSTAEAAAALLAERSTDATADALAEATDATGDEAGPTPLVPSSTASAAAPDEAHEADDEIPEFTLGEPEPDDADWLEPPDDDDEPQIAAVAAQPDDDEDEYADPEVKRLRAELTAARKRAEHFEKQNAKTAKKSWSKEAARYYPLADPESIAATSRRGFMRDAKAQHERLLPQFRRFQTAEKERLRAEAAKQWGPAVAAGAVPNTVDELEKRKAEARKSRNLGRVFKTMI